MLLSDSEEWQVADIESVIAPLFERCRAFVPPRVEVCNSKRSSHLVPMPALVVDY